MMAQPRPLRMRMHILGVLASRIVSAEGTMETVYILAVGPDVSTIRKHCLLVSECSAATRHCGVTMCRHTRCIQPESMQSVLQSLLAGVRITKRDVLQHHTPSQNARTHNAFRARNIERYAKLEATQNITVCATASFRKIAPFGPLGQHYALPHLCVS